MSEHFRWLPDKKTDISICRADTNRSFVLASPERDPTAPAKSSLRQSSTARQSAQSIDNKKARREAHPDQWHHRENLLSLSWSELDVGRDKQCLQSSSFTSVIERENSSSNSFPSERKEDCDCTNKSNRQETPLHDLRLVRWRQRGHFSRLSSAETSEKAPQ